MPHVSNLLHSSLEPFQTVMATSGIAISSQNGSNGECEGLLTQHIVVPAVLTLPPVAIALALS